MLYYQKHLPLSGIYFHSWPPLRNRVWVLNSLSVILIDHINCFPDYILISFFVRHSSFMVIVLYIILIVTLPKGSVSNWTQYFFHLCFSYSCFLFFLPLPFHFLFYYGIPYSSNVIMVPGLQDSLFSSPIGYQSFVSFKDGSKWANLFSLWATKNRFRHV